MVGTFRRYCKQLRMVAFGPTMYRQNTYMTDYPQCNISIHLRTLRPYTLLEPNNTIQTNPSYITEYVIR